MSESLACLYTWVADQTRAESRVADIFLGEDFFLFVCLIFATRGRDSFCHVTLYSGKRHDDDCLFWVEIKKKKQNQLRLSFFPSLRLTFILYFLKIFFMWGSQCFPLTTHSPSIISALIWTMNSLTWWLVKKRGGSCHGAEILWVSIAWPPSEEVSTPS